MGTADRRVILRRGTRPLAAISLVPMVDVLLILLVFFMVTSTYLDLDMIPAGESRDGGGADGRADAGLASSVLLSLRADGSVSFRGRNLDRTALGREIVRELQRNPLLSVLILPSGAASTQDLVTVLDVLTAAGATRVRVIRLETAL